MTDRDPPGYDDWFDEPEPPTLESGRGNRPSYDIPAETEEDVWTLPEDESRRKRTTGRSSLTTTQIAIIAVAGLAVFIALLAAAGVFSSNPPSTAPTITTPTTLPTTRTTPTTTPTVAAPTQPLQEGDTGAQVKLLQLALISLKYMNPPADGSYGPATKTAVMQFQSQNGLSPDGAVGPQTLAALKTALKG